MRVFLSWSGERSGALAAALRDWLPNVLQAVNPWLSSRDIDKGARWASELKGALDATKVGVICVTPECVGSPWLLFEAGAISRSLDPTFICPYLLDMKASDLQGPLAQFQMSSANRADTLALCMTLNRGLEAEGLKDQQLERVFAKWWPELEDALTRLPEAGRPSRPKQRSDRELLEEILNSLRQRSREAALAVELAGRGWELTVTFSGPAAAAQSLLEDLRLAAPKARLSSSTTDGQIFIDIETPAWIPEHVYRMVAERHGCLFERTDYIG